MKGCIVHDKNGLGLWPFTTVLKELLDEIFKDGSIG